MNGIVYSTVGTPFTVQWAPGLQYKTALTHTGRVGDFIIRPVSECVVLFCRYKEPRSSSQR